MCSGWTSQRACFTQWEHMKHLAIRVSLHSQDLSIILLPTQHIGTQLNATFTAIKEISFNQPVFSDSLFPAFCQDFWVTELFSEMTYENTEIIPKDQPCGCSHKEQECFHKISSQGYHQSSLETNGVVWFLQNHSWDTVALFNINWEKTVETGLLPNATTLVSEDPRQGTWCPGVHVFLPLTTCVTLTRPYLWFGPHSTLFFGKTKWVITVFAHSFLHTVK